MCIETGTAAFKGCVLEYCVAILLCFATQCLQIAVEWLRQGSSFAAAACVILSRLAARSRKSHCSCSVRRVNGALAADFFPILAVMIFLLTSASKSSFFRFGVEIRFSSCKSLQFVEPSCMVSPILQLKVVNPREERAAVLLTFMAAFLRA